MLLISCRHKWSWFHIELTSVNAGRCTALAVVLVSVTASVPPLTITAPRRTRRSPPRVLFPECAGSCACLLRAPAPRPGVSVATGLCRMSARPTIQANQLAPAKLRRCKARALRKHNPPLTPTALSFSLGPFRGPALRRSYSRRPSYGRSSWRTDLPPQPP